MVIPRPVDAARSVWKPVRVEQTVRGKVCGKVQPRKLSKLQAQAFPYVFSEGATHPLHFLYSVQSRRLDPVLDIKSNDIRHGSRSPDRDN